MCMVLSLEHIASEASGGGARGTSPARNGVSSSRRVVTRGELPVPVVRYGSLRRNLLAHAYTLQVTDRASRGSLSLSIYVILTTVSIEI